MIFGQTMKHVSLIKPVSVATNATQTGRVDTRGFKHCRIAVHLDSQSSTTSAPAVLKLTEGDADDTNTAAVVAFTGGTATSTSVGFVIPNSGTAPTFVILDIDCRRRKRYLTLSLTSGDAAQLSSAQAILSRGEIQPDTATEVGAAVQVIG